MEEYEKKLNTFLGLIQELLDGERLRNEIHICRSDKDEVCFAVKMTYFVDDFHFTLFTSFFLEEISQTKNMIDIAMTYAGMLQRMRGYQKLSTAERIDKFDKT